MINECNSKTVLIIPAYNEEENIERVVGNLIKDFPEYDYIIVNDGSTDATAAVCEKNGFNYLSLPENVGLAGAFKAGMKYADKYGYGYAVQFDGDGQHNAEYVKNMLDAMNKNGLDIVIGSRFVEKKKPFSARMLGNNVIQAAVLITTGKNIKDTTSGMRIYNRRLIKILAKNYDLGPEPDTLAFLLRCGAKIGEVQVEMSERTAGTSYLNFTRSIEYMFRMCMSIFCIQWFRKTIKIESEEAK